MDGCESQRRVGTDMESKKQRRGSTWSVDVHPGNLTCMLLRRLLLKTGNLGSNMATRRAAAVLAVVCAVLCRVRFAIASMWELLEFKLTHSLAIGNTNIIDLLSFSCPVIHL